MVTVSVVADESEVDFFDLVAFLQRENEASERSACEVGRRRLRRG